MVAFFGRDSLMRIRCDGGRQPIRLKQRNINKNGGMNFGMLMFLIKRRSNSYKTRNFQYGLRIGAFFLPFLYCDKNKCFMITIH